MTAVEKQPSGNLTQDQAIEILNTKLAEFKTEFDLVAIEGWSPNKAQKLAEILAKYNPEIAALCVTHGGAFKMMTDWINSGEGNYYPSRHMLELMGVLLPFELAYIFLIGIGEEEKALAIEIIDKEMDQQREAKRNPNLSLRNPDQS